MSIYQEKPIVKVTFVISKATGSDGPQARIYSDADEQSIASQLIAKALAIGGVWDERGEVFHPWHTIVRVEWQRDEMTHEETQREVARGDVEDFTAEQRVSSWLSLPYSRSPITSQRRRSGDTASLTQ